MTTQKVLTDILHCPLWSTYLLCSPIMTTNPPSAKARPMRPATARFVNPSVRTLAAQPRKSSEGTRKSKTKSKQSCIVLNGRTHCRSNCKNTGLKPYALPESINLKFALCNSIRNVCIADPSVPTDMSAKRCQRCCPLRKRCKNGAVLRPDANKLH